MYFFLSYIHHSYFLGQVGWSHSVKIPHIPRKEERYITGTIYATESSLPPFDLRVATIPFVMCVAYRAAYVPLRVTDPSCRMIMMTCSVMDRRWRNSVVDDFGHNGTDTTDGTSTLQLGHGGRPPLVSRTTKPVRLADSYGRTRPWSRRHDGGHPSNDLEYASS